MIKSASNTSEIFVMDRRTYERSRVFVGGGSKAPESEEYEDRGTADR